MATIQGIYIALFGRPADPIGFRYFDGITKHGADLSAIGNLSGQLEYLDHFKDMTNEDIVRSIYRNLFPAMPNRKASTSLSSGWWTAG